MTTNPIPVPDLLPAALIAEDSGRDTYPPTQASFYVLFDPISCLLDFDNAFQPGRPVPEDIWYLRKLRFPLPRNVDETVLVNTLRGSSAQALLQRIADGFSIASDKYNQVGSMTDDAETASNELAGLLEQVPLLPYEFAGLWHAADWPELSREALVDQISADDSDDGLAHLEEQLAAEARAKGAVLVSLDAYLKYLRDEVPEATEEG